MDKSAALEKLNEFLEQNPNYKPTEQYRLSEPQQQTVNDEVFYFFWWIEDNGQNARGGSSYYVMPDGEVLMPNGGSAQPESTESVYARWQSQ